MDRTALENMSSEELLKLLPKEQQQAINKAFAKIDADEAKAKEEEVEWFRDQNDRMSDDEIRNEAVRQLVEDYGVESPNEEQINIVAADLTKLYGKDGWDHTKDAIGTVSDKALKAMDYVSGATRATAAGIADPLVEGDLVQTEGFGDSLAGAAGAALKGDFSTAGQELDKNELLKALTMRGDFPTTSDYLERGGAGEMGSVETPFGRITGRDAIGFVGDVGLDLGTYATGGLNQVAKYGLKKGVGQSAGRKVLGTIARPLGRPLEKLGRWAYSSAGIRNMDSAAARVGKGDTAVSDVLWDNDIWGRNKSIADQADHRSKSVGYQRDKILDDIDAQGAKMDFNRAFGELDDELDDIRFKQDPRENDIADGIAGEANRYRKLQVRPASKPKYNYATGMNEVADKGFEGVGAGAGSSMKSMLYNNIPDSVWDKLAKTARGTQLQTLMAKGMKEEVERLGKQFGHGNKVKELNDEWGILLSARQAMRNEAEKEARKRAFTPTDAILGSFGFLMDQPGATRKALFPLAAKKATEVGNSTLFTTGLGQALKGVNRSKVPAYSTFNQIINSTRRPDEEEEW